MGASLKPLHYVGAGLVADQLSVTRGGVSSQGHVNPTPLHEYVGEMFQVILL